MTVGSSLAEALCLLQGSRWDHEHGGGARQESAAHQEAALWQDASRRAEVFLAALNRLTLQQCGNGTLRIMQCHASAEGS